ncbi:MAG: phytanoyl-CoA dioxygenase family protein [Deltaproteobacteria bacterium]|nr:phytanoyl-CoA dioxygenase family protein [Deltaproteobacteria bacterium]
MKLSDDDARVFHEGGFVVLRGLFDESEVAPVRAALERLYATAQTLRATGDHDGAFFVLSAPPEPERAVVVQRVVWAGGAEPVLLRLSEDPRLVEPALSLLGTSTCEQLLCQAHYKMPNDGVAFDWHQDIQHRDKGGDTWRDVTGRGSYVQSILLVDDMTEENGPLEFVPKSAAVLDDAGRLVKAEGVQAVDPRRAIPVTGRAGDVLLFGPYAVHGSTPNVSAKPRRVLINGYAAPGANKRFYPGRGACRVLPLGASPAAEESATRLVRPVAPARSA